LHRGPCRSPLDPDSEYGREKLFSERQYLSYHRNYGLDMRIARFHDIPGEGGIWTGRREKPPAAICRKVADVERGREIEIWVMASRPGRFRYIDECLDSVLCLMRADYGEPVNID
jgi:GDP-D-mannose 3', 5'-epimerase